MCVPRSFFPHVSAGLALNVLERQAHPLIGTTVHLKFLVGTTGLTGTLASLVDAFARTTVGRCTPWYLAQLCPIHKTPHERQELK